VVRSLFADRDVDYVGLKQAGQGDAAADSRPLDDGNRSYSVFGDVSLGGDGPLDHWAGDWSAYRLKAFDHLIKGSR